MLEEWRIATNSERSAVNARLTSAGLEPVALAPSLEELSQELHGWSASTRHALRR